MKDETTPEVKQTQEEIDADLQKRVEAFNGELIPLLGKYEVGLGATAFVTPDGRIGARPTLFNAPPEKKASPAPEGAIAPAQAPAEAPTAPVAPLADSAA